MPCLEELDLTTWVLSNELMYRILSGCAGTLKKLTLETIYGFDEGLFLYDNGSNSNGVGSKWILPHVVFLRLRLAWAGPPISVLLPQLCPSLEYIRLTLDMEQYSLPELVSALRKNCPKLHTIRYFEGYSDSYDLGFPPEPQLYASLFKDSFSTPGLRYATMELPEGLDQHMLDALLFHASTLETLEFKFSLNERSSDRQPFCTTQDMKRVVELLVRCEKLKIFGLSQVNCLVQTLDELSSLPWRCCGLERLNIDGYRPSYPIHQGMRQQGFHQEYRDVGQGWFLKPELDTSSLKDALLDGGWKRRLFGHMYRISGIKHAKYVKLNKTEFFAKDLLPST
ncbi:hypothetical protein BGZ65_002331 [Modicella reniformis]|uniref:Uncharacterized protein n=1 Tax=Modicella reniformis TaxID=1440133 RepID=A0A9P6J190_9FUNG|nr:hypothetical protein BGZ65_002331 [Modicella reniformis]